MNAIHLHWVTYDMLTRCLFEENLSGSVVKHFENSCSRRGHILFHEVTAWVILLQQK